MSKVTLERKAEGPVLASQRLRLAVSLAKGTFSLGEGPGGRRLLLPRAATAAVLSEGAALGSDGAGFVYGGDGAVDDAHGRGRSLLLRRRRRRGEPELTLSVTLYEEQPFAVLQSALENAAEEPLRARAFHVLEGGPLRLGGRPSGWRFYKQGWQNWSPTLVLPCSGEDLPMAPPVVGPGTQPARRRGRFLSDMVTTVVDPSGGRAVTAGFVSTAQQFSQVWLDRGTRALTAASYPDGVEVPPGGRLASERLLVEPAERPLESLQRYGDALAREAGAVPWPRPVSGWCSWYYYWQGISEEIILANLEELARRRDEIPVEYVQVDDGWQAGIGDWLSPNEKFPRGMGYLAGEIQRRGFKAGLWLAPFLMGEGSRLWREHPEWAVQYRPGRPYVAMVNWGQDCYALDLTRPEVMRWLDGVFGTVFHEWGYDYVKIDFLYAGAVDGIRQDADVTRAQAYRRGVEVARRHAGDRFVLGCGNPMGPSVGLVNGTRIGPDVAPFWYPAEPPREEGRSDLSTVSTANALRNVLGRFWMHGRLWLNDPDCLLARDSETALTADEVRTLATAIGLSGGMALDSDNLLRLSPERRELLSFLLPPYGRSALPLDLFESETPRLFELDCGSHRLLGVFNWSDAPAEVAVPLPERPVHVFEVWRREYLGTRTDGLTLPLPAHGCALLALRPAAGGPRLVGSTFHLAQGAMELASESRTGRELRLSLRPVAVRRGEVFVFAPPGLAGPVLEGPAGLSLRPDGLLALSLQLERPLRLRLRFSGG